VRGAALEGLVRARGDAAFDELRRASIDPSFVVRAAAARAATGLSVEPALAALIELARDQDALVAETALASLGTLAAPEARVVLAAALAHPDPGLRLAALDALGERVTAADVPALGLLVQTSGDALAAEIAFGAVRALVRIGDELARERAASGLVHPDPHVRRVAREALGVAAAEVEPLYPSGRSAPSFAGLAQNPLVSIETTRGTLVFELFPAEAPRHVESFVALARRGHYDGLRFHRVVPDFVVQGGDHRGDGNGGCTFDDAGLRHEIGPRKYVRGSLGMPRNEDLESGGCQIFVTHRPTPHLDGRYTIFGELRKGFEALDALEVGDRIVAVRFR
jgi:cyclophilin family peptidyl-prolyl cis-trans isomerase